MNLQILVAVAEIVSALAVTFPLIAVIITIRQNTRSEKALVVDSLAAAIASINVPAMESHALGSAMSKATINWGSASRRRADHGAQLSLFFLQVVGERLVPTESRNPYNRGTANLKGRELPGGKLPGLIQILFGDERFCTESRANVKTKTLGQCAVRAVRLSNAGKGFDCAPATLTRPQQHDPSSERTASPAHVVEESLDWIVRYFASLGRKIGRASWLMRHALRSAVLARFHRPPEL